ncbi:hypothetical protein [Nocardia transvalensis]|uniref:hypothetical protein n=1 Tax=Nocardia transvalensis TaxID=37333 RepID=UPI001893E538|nr:hypothetical protein [Nocardia transvalensis]MBF6330316.1 hypothetical protein [Nocardia transvalensis]
MSVPVSLLDQPLEPLVGWAARELAAQGIAVCGAAEEMRRRDWTLLARIPTDIGPVWAKASSRAFAHEGPLLQTLARLAPGSVLEPLAVHRDNGWLVSPDGGATLPEDPSERHLIDGAAAVVRPDPDRWRGILRSYAALQHRLSAHLGELRGAGVPVLPPGRLITVYRRFEHRAPGLGPAIERAAAELAAFGRLSLEHNDLHPRHVFDSTTTLFDWGDALITHPFLSIRTLRDPLRAAYFDQWRAVSTVTAGEIALAECLAPLTALHPFVALDAWPDGASDRLAPFVDTLLGQLRAALTG